jgi:hypothetical protein
MMSGDKAWAGEHLPRRRALAGAAALAAVVLVAAAFALSQTGSHARRGVLIGFRFPSAIDWTHATDVPPQDGYELESARRYLGTGVLVLRVSTEPLSADTTLLAMARSKAHAWKATRVDTVVFAAPASIRYPAIGIVSTFGSGSRFEGLRAQGEGQDIQYFVLASNRRIVQISCAAFGPALGPVTIDCEKALGSLSVRAV